MQLEVCERMRTVCVRGSTCALAGCVLGALAEAALAGAPFGGKRFRLWVAGLQVARLIVGEGADNNTRGRVCYPAHIIRNFQLNRSG